MDAQALKDFADKTKKTDPTRAHIWAEFVNILTEGKDVALNVVKGAADIPVGGYALLQQINNLKAAMAAKDATIADLQKQLAAKQ